MSNFPPSIRNDEKFINDDFAAPHADEEKYDGDLAQHPAVLDAFRFQAQLNNLVVTDTASFANVVSACLENINDRLLELQELPVTIYAPASHVIRSSSYADLEDGEASVNNDSLDISEHDDEGDTSSVSVTSEKEHADCIKGPFGGFSFLFEELSDDDGDEVGYRVNIYARTRSNYTETPLIVASIFDAVRLSQASIAFDQDMLSHDLEFASDTLDAYQDTRVYDKLLEAEQIINNSSFTHGHLQKIDEACRNLFAEKGMAEEFPIQDSLVDLMKLYHSPDEEINFTSAVIMQLERIEPIGQLSYFTPAAGKDRSVIKCKSSLIDYAFLPRTIINEESEYELSDETLGLYLAIDLAGGKIGYIPAEHIKLVA